jgi:hypothetical protein
LDRHGEQFGGRAFGGSMVGSHAGIVKGRGARGEGQERGARSVPSPLGRGLG